MSRYGMCQILSCFYSSILFSLQWLVCLLKRIFYLAGCCTVLFFFYHGKNFSIIHFSCLPGLLDLLNLPINSFLKNVSTCWFGHHHCFLSWMIGLLNLYWHIFGPHIEKQLNSYQIQGQPLKQTPDLLSAYVSWNNRGVGHETVCQSIVQLHVQNVCNSYCMWLMQYCFKPHKLELRVFNHIMIV